MRREGRWMSHMGTFAAAAWSTRQAIQTATLARLHVMKDTGERDE